MESSTSRSIFSGSTSHGMTFSSLFGASSGIYQFNVPESPSLINFIPSSIRGVSRDGHHHMSADVTVDDEFLDAPAEKPVLELENEKCLELWRAFKDEAGSWYTHRFDMSSWGTPKDEDEINDEKPRDTEASEGFDGVLTKSLIAPNLSRLERSPELQHYAYTKCVLIKKKLINIDAIDGYRYLQYLDVSSNKLTSLKPLSALPYLKILNASHNLLTAILDFNGPFFLTVVNLSYNNIKQMRDLSQFWSITDLNLSYNMIRTIDGIKALKYLSSLNLSFNRIETIENLSGLRINYLYLQNNAIKVFEDAEVELYTLKNLRTINLSYNQVSSLKIFENVKNLEFLDIVNNNVSKLLDIYYLRKLKYLNKLNLTGNPVTNIGRYFEVCLRHIKNLTLLDNQPINSDSWLQELSNEANDVTQVAAQNRLKLTVLEQLKLPQLWFWLPPYDSPPIAVIILVGLQVSRRAYIAKKFCESQKNIVLGIPHTTRPKHPNEIEGEHFFYVDEETFTTKLKDGDFLTYQEILGSYYGIAYSEFEKAKNGIIMFYTDLTMALAIKRIFFNTILVLALPSSKQAHFEKLNILYSVQVNEDGTLKMNSPVAPEYQIELPKKGKENEPSMQAQEILNELVNEVWQLVKDSESVDDNENDANDTKEEETSRRSSSRQTSVSDSRKSEKSEILQLWWSSGPTTAMSIVIQPAHVSEEDQKAMVTNTRDDSEQSKMNNEGSVTEQMKRYVSFTVAHVHKFHEPRVSEERDVFETGPKHSEDSKGRLKQKADDSRKRVASIEDSVPNLKITSINSTAPDIRTSPAYTACPLATKNLLKDSQCFADILIRDERIRALFDEELRRRDELLELHLDMPGLFRELLFTDDEEESLKKLTTLLLEINRYNETGPKAILNFENDANFADMVHAKVENCFVELKKAVSISQKQAAEYTVKKYPHRCDQGVCLNPSCPHWRKT